MFGDSIIEEIAAMENIAQNTNKFKREVPPKKAMQKKADLQIESLDDSTLATSSKPSQKNSFSFTSKMKTPTPQAKSLCQLAPAPLKPIKEQEETKTPSKSSAIKKPESKQRRLRAERAPKADKENKNDESSLSQTQSRPESSMINQNLVDLTLSTIDNNLKIKGSPVKQRALSPAKQKHSAFGRTLRPDDQLLDCSRMSASPAKKKTK